VSLILGHGGVVDLSLLHRTVDHADQMMDRKVVGFIPGWVAIRWLPPGWVAVCGQVNHLSV